jgi:hypothetical protein
MLEEIHALRDLIGADEHTSLLTELKLLRRDLGERISRIEHSLEFFPERVARQNTKARVEARKGTGASMPATGDNNSSSRDDRLREGHVEST